MMFALDVRRDETRKPLIVTQFPPHDGSLPPAVDPWSPDWDSSALPPEEVLPPSALAATSGPATAPTVGNRPPTGPMVANYQPAAPVGAHPPTAPTVRADPHAPTAYQPRSKRRRGIVTGVATVLVIAGAVTAAVLVGQDGNKNNADASGFTKPTATPTVASKTTAAAAPTASAKPSVSPAAPAPGACAHDTWTATSETYTVNSDVFGTGTGTVTLTDSTPHETRTFNPDGTGEITMMLDYVGQTSDGTDVAILQMAKGTFTYKYNGSTVTYLKVILPGTIQVEVAGVKQAPSNVGQVEVPGSDPMSCSGNTLTQHGDNYSRTYTRKAL